MVTGVSESAGINRLAKLRETQTIKLFACGWASPRRQGVAESLGSVPAVSQ
jgi:hypothetical protein